MAAQFWTAIPLFLIAIAGADMPSDEIEPAQDDYPIGMSLEDDVAQQISFEQVVVIRVPRTSRAVAGEADGRGDMRCLDASRLIGMRVSKDGEMDLLTKDGWYRAHLEDDCDARQFYSGFYVAKARDGQFCAHREELRSRSGTMCELSGFTRWSR